MKTHGYLGMRANIGLVLALDPMTMMAVAVAVSAGTSVAAGVMNYEASRAAKDKQRSLENEQNAELDHQAQVLKEQQAAQAITGSTFGFGSSVAPKATATGLGFGTGTPAGPTNSTGFGRSALTGGS